MSGVRIALVGPATAWPIGEALACHASLRGVRFSSLSPIMLNPAARPTGHGRLKCWYSPRIGVVGYLSGWGVPSGALPPGATDLERGVTARLPLRPVHHSTMWLPPSGVCRHQIRGQPCKLANGLARRMVHETDTISGGVTQRESTCFAIRRSLVRFQSSPPLIRPA